MTRDTIDPERRAFLLGQLGTEDAEPPVEHHISSMVVHALPDAADAVSEALSAMEGMEIHARDPSGKMVVTLESPDDTTIVERLNAIHIIPGVLSAALVFHHFE